MQFKTLTSEEFDKPSLIGSLIKVCNKNPNGTKILSFYLMDHSGYIDVQNNTIFVFLGKEKVTVIDWVDDKDDEEIRYKFLYDNKIIYSVDPARYNKFRSFIWELVVEDLKPI